MIFELQLCATSCGSRDQAGRHLGRRLLARAAVGRRRTIRPRRGPFSARPAPSSSSASASNLRLNSQKVSSVDRDIVDKRVEPRVSTRECAFIQISRSADQSRISWSRALFIYLSVSRAVSAGENNRIRLNNRDFKSWCELLQLGLEWCHNLPGSQLWIIIVSDFYNVHVLVVFE